MYKRHGVISNKENLEEKLLLSNYIWSLDYQTS